MTCAQVYGKRRMAARLIDVDNDECLVADGPVLDHQFRHRKVFRVTRDQTRTDGVGSGSDQTICLREGPASGRILASPLACLPPLSVTQRRHLETFEQPMGRFVLGRSQATHCLFDVDGADVGCIAACHQSAQPAHGRRAPAQEVDHDGGVQQDRAH